MATVVIVGGGVAGLSAAHELAERGFKVAVYEKRHWGGKARSIAKPGSGVDGRRDLPGEHGFRFFPGFYKHMPDTMKRIPFGGNPQGVFDNLVPATAIDLAREGERRLLLPTSRPATIEGWLPVLRDMMGADTGIPDAELEFYAGRILTLLTTCHERRLAEYEKIPWWDFIQAAGMSEPYRRLLAEGLTRSLVAMRAEVASTRTTGNGQIQLSLNTATRGETSDRLLNGPTNEVWIGPWLDYLRSRDVELHMGADVQSFDVEGGRIKSVTFTIDGTPTVVSGDYYLAAVPVEVMAGKIKNLAAAAPSLAQIGQLKVEWMNGIQLFLRRDVPIVHGHTIYADSAWALTSVSQAQFWAHTDLSTYGDGSVHGVLSIDISDWDTPGNKVVHKPAHQCSGEEIFAEVLAQVQAHLNQGGTMVLDASDVATWMLDPDISFPHPDGDEDAEPLLINTANSWRFRPEAVTEIPNLFLASDYVRTHTDIATMEAANEAARRAVNGVLAAAGSDAAPCTVWPFEEPEIFAPFRAYDYVRFKLGLPHAKPHFMPAAPAAPAPASDVPMTLPAADGVVKDHLLQWWYWSGHLTSRDGREFGFMVVFFVGEVMKDRVWGNVAQCGLSDIGAQRFVDRDISWPGEPRVRDSAFQLEIPGGVLEASGGNGSDVLRFEVKGYSAEIRLQAVRSPTLHYGGRNHTYGFGGNTYYYSRELMVASGRVTTPEGEFIDVEGTGWFDRQYGQLAPAVLLGWQWFAIQLDGDTQIMLFCFNEADAERCGSITDAGGKVTDLASADIDVQILGYWQSPESGIRYPQGWKVTLPGHVLVITPKLANQEMSARFWMGPRYWEGACAVTGTSTGHAFVELLGFAHT